MKRLLMAGASIPLAALPPMQVRGDWVAYWITSPELGAVKRLFSEHHPPTVPAGWRLMTEAERRAHIAG